MGKYIVKRLFAMALTLFIIITISFFAIRLIPGDVLGEGANPELRAAMRARYHLDKPLVEQYAIFLRNFISFDFGESITLYPRRPVFEIMTEKIPMTLVLNIFSLIITIPIGIACGIIAALKKNTLADNAISTMVVINVSVPSFVFASLLQYFFAYKLGWFPILLNLKAAFMSPAQLWSMILPVLALSFGGIATIARYMRAELFEALSSEYMLACACKGSDADAGDRSPRAAQLVHPAVQHHRSDVHERIGRLGRRRENLQYSRSGLADDRLNQHIGLLPDYRHSLCLLPHQFG